MRRFERYNDTNFAVDMNSEDYKYQMALKRVKRIKGFYVHLTVYILVNTFIIIANTYNWDNESGTRDFWSWQTFSTAIFWGIGLLANAVSVFGGQIFLGQNWEENKIKELMQKEKTEKWE